MDKLFAPSSVAVIGVSTRVDSPTRIVLDNIVKSTAQTRVYAVNPKYTEIGGVECFPSVGDLPEPIDCAFVGVRSELGPAMLQEVANAGIRAAVINAADYGSGGEAGRARLALIRDIARSSSIALCGPNNIGLYNITKDVGCWALRHAEFEPGRIALITHSGVAAMVLIGDPYQVGLSHVVTCGDEAVLSAADYLEYLIEDDSVRVVMLYLETLRDPITFGRAASRAADLGKRIVVLKVGRSEVGSRAVAAHTGAIAGEDELYTALFRRYGVVRVRDMDEMIQTALLAAAFPDSPKRRGFVAVTNSGGIATLVADVASDCQLPLPALTPETAAKITAADPALTRPQNPVDTWGVGWNREAFPAVLSALAQQDDVGCVGIVLAMPGSGGSETGTGRAVAKILADQPTMSGPKFVLINCNAQGNTDSEVVAVLKEAGLPCLMGVPESLRAIGHWIDWPHRPNQTSRLPLRLDLLSSAESWVDQATRLREIGLPIVETRKVDKEVGDAIRQASVLGSPVAMKGLHRDVPHKSEAGLVLVGLETPDQVAEAFDDICKALTRNDIDPQEAEIVVQPMRGGGLELIAGFRNFPGFGTMVVLGLGGIYVEVLRAAVARIAPLDLSTVNDMLAELAIDGVLAGFRGRAPYDKQALVDFVMTLGDTGIALQGQVDAMEINPLSVFEEGRGVLGLDLLVDFSETALQEEIR